MEKPEVVILPPNEIGEKEQILFRDGNLINVIPEPGPRPYSTQDNSTEYFGVWDDVLDPDFITRADVLEVCDPAGINLFDDGWLKYKHNGKYLYVAKKPFKYSVSWDSLYLLGAIYGTSNDSGPYSTQEDYNPRELFINQDATITKNGFKYKIRVLTGGNENPANSGGGEWNELILPLLDGTFDTLTKYDIHALGLGPFSPGVSGDGGVSWCQETVLDQNYPEYRLSRSDSLSFVGVSASNTGNSFGWRPVLELISTVNVKKI
jgi:hypothetical protein